jgi:hypothetical protein
VVIDWDTLMPGYYWSDVGDLIRSCAASGAEDCVEGIEVDEGRGTYVFASSAAAVVVSSSSSATVSSSAMPGPASGAGAVASASAAAVGIGFGFGVVPPPSTDVLKSSQIPTPTPTPTHTHTHTHTHMQWPIVDAAVQGWVDGWEGALSPVEKGNIWFGGKYLVYMQFLRFLTDWLRGDVYYRVKDEMQNWRRSVVQLAVLEAICERHP